MRGLSKTSAVLSGNTPAWLLAFFWPVTYDDMPGDESVITALSEPVITRPVTSSVSIARRPAALPLCSRATRCAPRCGAPRPCRRRAAGSCCARGAARGRPARPRPRPAGATRPRAPSAVVARMTSAPAASRLKRRDRKFAVPAAAPSWARRVVARRPFEPSTHTRRPAGAAPWSPVASTRMSTSCPAARTPPSGGMMRMVVAASARAGMMRRRAARGCGAWPR